MSGNRAVAAGIGAALLAACGGYAATVSAAGFQLFEYSPSGLGNALAGNAAVAEDASTIFGNPAGMTYLPGRQAVLGANVFSISSEFSNSGSHLNAPLAAIPLTGGNGGNAGGWNVVPNLYLSWQLSPQWFAGIGVNAPFGLRTNYDSDWVGRYQGIKSELTTYNINPSIAYKVNQVVSLGLGISFQHVDADLTKAIDFGTITTLAPQALDGGQQLKANSWGYGANVGAMFQISSDMRIGLAYRSQVKQTLEGSSTFTGVPGPLAANPLFQNSSAKAEVTFPESASLSVFQQYDERWAIMGDITWTHWSRFQELRVQFANGAPDNVTPENWENTFRVSLGLTYQLNPKWKLRGGVAYDQSPVSDPWRTVRIPDSDRTWLAFGASWTVAPSATLDLGYAHLFVKDASINKMETVSGTVIGSYNNSADVFSLGLSFRF